MKVTIFNAISIDGFIATNDDDTSWVTDSEHFEKEIKKNNVIIYGRRTYDDLVKAGFFPYEGVKNVIYTRTPEKYDNDLNIEFSDLEPEKLIRQLEYQGHTNILIAGGGKTNAAFINLNLVDEVIIDVHPIILGVGIKLFESEELQINLEFVSSKKLNDGIVQLRYKVLKEVVE